MGNVGGFCLGFSAAYLGLDRELGAQTWLIGKPKYSSSQMVTGVFDEFAPSLRFLTSEVPPRGPRPFSQSLGCNGPHGGPVCGSMGRFLTPLGLSVVPNVLFFLVH